MQNSLINSQHIPSTIAVEHITNINKVVSQHGLYGEFILFKNESGVLGSGPYLVISTEPIPQNINPYKISNKIKRDRGLFYPKVFAFPITEENSIVAIDSVMSYCKDAEFLFNLYEEFGAELPERIRYSELAGLKNWHEGRTNPDANIKFQQICNKGLKTFFKDEKSSLGKEKRVFFRSSRYDEKASAIQRKQDFANRNSSIVRLNVLLHSTTDIGRKQVGSAEFDAFCKYMKSVYPEVLFAVSEKEVIDLGFIELAKKDPDNPFFKRKYVTDAEFRNIITERFATEGYACIKDVQPAYWEYYDIYYKKIDEPEIITAYNDVFLRFADHDPLYDISIKGPMYMITLPVDDFHYFVALAKNEKLPFHIDHKGEFSIPSFNDIHVIYSARDQEVMNHIVEQMIDYDILNSHIISKEAITTSLNDKIQNANEGLENGNEKGNYKQDLER